MKNKITIFAVSMCAAFLSSCAPKTDTTTAAAASTDSLAMTIAYINTDSLLLNYEYAKKMSDLLLNKEETSRTDFNQKYRVFQQDAVEFQRKVQNNGFLSMERAQSEQQRLQKAEQDLQELNERLSNDLLREQTRINRELRDTLINFLDEYAKGKYQLILSNTMGDNVLYSAPGVDITNEVVEKLNERYAKANATKK